MKLNILMLTFVAILIYFGSAGTTQAEGKGLNAVKANCDKKIAVRMHTLQLLLDEEAMELEKQKIKFQSDL
jgi:hypothetical protein